MSEAEQPGANADKVVIKKYANRRLYNTRSSAYVTLEHLSTMVKEKTDFVVYDAKTGEDITRPVLTQIIFEEESKGGQTLLPIPFLRQLISFYGDSLQGIVPQYLEMSMSQFARNQERMRSYLQNAFGYNPFQQFESMGKQNMAMFENAMRMFNPFAAGQNGARIGSIRRRDYQQDRNSHMISVGTETIHDQSRRRRRKKYALLLVLRQEPA